MSSNVDFGTFFKKCTLKCLLLFSSECKPVAYQGFLACEPVAYQVFLACEPVAFQAFLAYEVYSSKSVRILGT